MTTEKDISYFTDLWVRDRLSNFDYLMTLNTYAQRSFMDLTQYPVFPWVIKDYESEKLDLLKPDTFRDLSKPIGALGDQKRLNDFRMRYNESPEGQNYMYGSHVSCPGYVIGFHLRKNPQLMIKFQSGKFDNPNRMFKGIKDCWDGCMTSSTDVKELIPEFFMNDTAIFENKLNLELGTRSNGDKVEDVILPKWAMNAEDFLVKQR